MDPTNLEANRDGLAGLDTGDVAALIAQRHGDRLAVVAENMQGALFC